MKKAFCLSFSLLYKKETGMKLDKATVHFTGGPTRQELFDSFIKGEFQKFGTAPQEVLGVVINSLSRENGSGNSWLFAGWEDGEGVDVSGYYDSLRRTGLWTLDSGHRFRHLDRRLSSLNGALEE